MATIEPNRAIDEIAGAKRGNRKMIIGSYQLS